MSRPINPTQDIKMSKNSQTSTHAVLGTIFLQKCYASVAWAQPFFFVYMPRVSLCLYGTLHCSSKKNPPKRLTSCLWSDPASKMQILDVCSTKEERATWYSSEKRQRTIHVLLRRAAVVLPPTLTAMLPSLSRPPALLEISVKKEQKSRCSQWTM